MKAIEKLKELYRDINARVAILVTLCLAIPKMVCDNASHFKSDNKAQIAGLQGFIITIASIVILGGIVLYLLISMQSSLGSSDFNNSTAYGITGITTILQFIPLIAIIYILVIVLGLVLGIFGGRAISRRRGKK